MDCFDDGVIIPFFIHALPKVACSDAVERAFFHKCVGTYVTDTNDIMP